MGQHVGCNNIVNNLNPYAKGFLNSMDDLKNNRVKKSLTFVGRNNYHHLKSF